MLLLGCASNAAPQQKSAGPKKLAGDALVYRFTDHAGEARAEGDLVAAWQKLSWPAKMVSPYSGLSGDDALRAAGVGPSRRTARWSNWSRRRKHAPAERPGQPEAARPLLREGERPEPGPGLAVPDPLFQGVADDGAAAHHGE